MKRHHFGALAPLLVILACSSTDDGDAFMTDPGMGEDTGDSDGGDGDGDDNADDGNEDDDSGLPKLDVEPEDEEEDNCTADDLDKLQTEEPPACSESAPPESFDPVLEWSYPKEGDPELSSMVIPLVINWTDDNDDGSIDMCDDPDVLVTGVNEDYVGQIHIIDGNYGDTGIVHKVLDQGIFGTGVPAVGDIDNDGEPEIVAVADNSPEDQNRMRLVAFDNDGSEMWVSEQNPEPTWNIISSWLKGGVALHDFNGDGEVEIVYNHLIYDANGKILFSERDDMGVHFLQESVAVDLDDDDRLELLTGYTAYSFDDDFNPTLLWDLNAEGILPATSVPHVANFDEDPDPEVLYTSKEGFFLVDHDGTYVWDELVIPEFDTWLPDYEIWLECTGQSAWDMMRPAAIIDFDGDGEVEIAVSTCNLFGIYEVDEYGVTRIFDADVQDSSGASGSTAYDFLGDARPEPIYSDEVRAVAWSGQDGTWEEALSVPRNSGTMMEYPVVADSDNDGSAEFLVVSKTNAPALQVFGDAQSRWIQARRIWNQQAYFVTNVYEDGTIPKKPIDNWDYLNTWRVNSPIEGGVPCVPPG